MSSSNVPTDLDPRVTLRFTANQRRWLEEMSRKRGLSITELIIGGFGKWAMTQDGLNDWPEDKAFRR